MDVKLIFLNGVLWEEVFVEQPFWYIREGLKKRERFTNSIRCYVGGSKHHVLGTCGLILIIYYNMDLKRVL